MGISIFIQEAFLSLKHNKVRSLLAGFGVAWGIFILILLLGTGKGFQEGIMKLFNAYAQNTISIFGGQTSENIESKFSEGKNILFTTNDIEILKNRFSSIESISPELNYNGSLLVSNQQNIGYFQIKAVYGNYFRIKTIKPDEGRLLDILDNKESRKVALIGRQVADNLFPKKTPIGHFISLAGYNFKVIGIIEKGSIFTQGEESAIYLPYNTFVDCFNQGIEFHKILLTLKKGADNSIFEKQLTAYLAWSKEFSVKDKKAIFITNYESQVESFNKLFNGINIFLWSIGLCLLLSGIVGISNIMLVIVKERTFEIGIRKAIGAKSGSILGMIISESVIVTSLAGIVGMVMGILVVWLINWVVSSFFTGSNILFTKAGIDFPVIFFSLFLLVLTGILAGLFPAKKAAEIAPVEAIRYESR